MRGDTAAVQGAHLVVINDPAEQEWLLGLFRNPLYWIGLSDSEKEGEWVWENGEPLTYANWGGQTQFSRAAPSHQKKKTVLL